MMLSDVTFTIEQCESIYFFLFFLFRFLSIYLSKSDTWKGLIRYNCCIVNIKSQKIVIIPTRKITRQCKNLLSKVELIISFPFSDFFFLLQNIKLIFQSIFLQNFYHSFDSFTQRNIIFESIFELRFDNRYIYI